MDPLCLSYIFTWFLCRHSTYVPCWLKNSLNSFEKIEFVSWIQLKVRAVWNDYHGSCANASCILGQHWMQQDARPIWDRSLVRLSLKPRASQFHVKHLTDSSSFNWLVFHDLKGGTTSFQCICIYRDVEIFVHVLWSRSVYVSDSWFPQLRHFQLVVFHHIC